MSPIIVPIVWVIVSLALREELVEMYGSEE
jgi:hypothetical protein